jgi:hypothetical protein
MKKDQEDVKIKQKSQKIAIKQYASSIVLPQISKSKQLEIETRKQSLIQAQAPVQRPEKPKVFDVKSYKTGVASSVDWEKVKKNPLVKEKEEKP